MCTDPDDNAPTYEEQFEIDCAKAVAAGLKAQNPHPANSDFATAPIEAAFETVIRRVFPPDPKPVLTGEGAVSPRRKLAPTPSKDERVDLYYSDFRKASIDQIERERWGTDVLSRYDSDWGGPSYYKGGYGPHNHRQRNRDAMRWHATGMTYKAIGERLGVSGGRAKQIIESGIKHEEKLAVAQAARETTTTALCSGRRYDFKDGRIKITKEAPRRADIPVALRRLSDRRGRAVPDYGGGSVNSDPEISEHALDAAPLWVGWDLARGPSQTSVIVITPSSTGCDHFYDLYLAAQPKIGDAEFEAAGLVEYIESWGRMAKSRIPARPLPDNLCGFWDLDNRGEKMDWRP